MSKANYPIPHSSILERFKINDAIIASMAGAVSCSIAHSLVVPLDVVKTKMQTDSAFAGQSILKVGRRIVSSKGGFSLLLQGLSATFIGYFLQGACKFGFYEHFKGVLFHCAENLHTTSSGTHKKENNARIPVLLTASSAAEAIACVFLSPLERTRIRMVVEKSEHGLIQSMKKIVSESGFCGLWLGLVPVLLKQIPYTAVKLSGYELMSNPIRKVITDCNKFTPEQETLLTGLTAGVLAGILAAAVSQPADALLSKVCGGSASAAEFLFTDGLPGLVGAFRELGIKKCYEGFRPRAIMIGTLTAGQMVIYENFKQAIHSNFHGQHILLTARPIPLQAQQIKK